MKEEWLMAGAVVPVDVETTAALVAEIRRLIDVVGGLVLKQGPDYERGFVDGMQKQMQSSVDRAVNQMAQQEPVLWEMPDGKTADKWALQFYGGQKGKPLYTAPPPCPTCEALARTVMLDQTSHDTRREWVGLTVDELITLEQKHMRHENLSRAIEQALKEKNT